MVTPNIPLPGAEHMISQLSDSKRTSTSVVVLAPDFFSSEIYYCSPLWVFKSCQKGPQVFRAFLKSDDNQLS